MLLKRQVYLCDNIYVIRSFILPIYHGDIQIYIIYKLAISFLS